ncbi:MAG: YdeI/OmpD-associated family protein [Chloroflexota bacterium]
MEPGDVRFFATPEELRDWFDANYATADVLWLGYHKKVTGRPSVVWSQAVDEALCVGWIDGVLRRIDDESHVQRFTPRRKGSNWSAINMAKVAALTAEDRMRPAGLAAFAARSEARTGVYSYERAPTVFADQEEDRFRADEAAWAYWEGRPASYRKLATHWVTGAKQATTRERRFSTLLQDSRAGRQLKQTLWTSKTP